MPFDDVGASRMKKLKLASAWLLMTAGLAQAADMPVKAPPPSPPALSWTGFYIGGNVGGAWAIPPRPRRSRTTPDVS
jgi:opacity protein-like surface antigen